MTRLYYWLHAQTQYNLHSPFLFDMYREVLFAPLTPEERRRHAIPRHDLYCELLYKCCNHYHLQPANSQQPIAHSTLLTPTQPSTLNNCQPDTGQFSILNSQFSILLVSHPHATPAAEAQWEHLKANPTYQVSLDLYDVALLIRNPRLSRQHFLLR